MNLLFERVRIQAQISRLYDLVGRTQADQVILQAWQIEQARQDKIAQPHEIDNSRPVSV